MWWHYDQLQSVTASNNKLWPVIMSRVSFSDGHINGDMPIMICQDWHANSDIAKIAMSESDMSRVTCKD